MRTRQEIFDLAYRGLRSQEFRMSGKPGDCLYRSPNGDKCAIGYCISDDRYYKAMEGGCDPAFPAAGVKDCDWSWAVYLQFCHDHSEGPADMQSRLEAFAATHSLTIPE